MDAVEIRTEHRLGGAAERERQAGGIDVGIAVAIAADPRTGPQEARRPGAQRALPACVQRGQHRQEAVAQVGERGLDLVGDIEPLAPERARLPQQGDLAQDGVVDAIAVVGLLAPLVLQRHQLGDAVPVIDHALAPDLGRMRGEHGSDEALRQQIERDLFGDALLGERLDRRGDIRAALGRDALPILRQIGEHREQHEAAHEGERVVEPQRVEPGIDAVRLRDAAMPIDRGGADIFDPPEQLVAPISADHVAEQAAEEADVGVLRDWGACHYCVLHCSDVRVNRHTTVPRTFVTREPATVSLVCRKTRASWSGARHLDLNKDLF